MKKLTNVSSIPGCTMHIAATREQWQKFTLHRGVFFGTDSHGLFVSFAVRDKYGRGTVIFRRNERGEWSSRAELHTPAAMAVEAYQHENPFHEIAERNPLHARNIGMHFGPKNSCRNHPRPDGIGRTLGEYAQSRAPYMPA